MSTIIAIGTLGYQWVEIHLCLVMANLRTGGGERTASVGRNDACGLCGLADVITLKIIYEKNVDVTNRESIALPTSFA